SFAKGAYGEGLKLEHKSLKAKLPELKAQGLTPPPAATGSKRGFETFYLEATDSKGQPVHQFKEPLTLTVHYTPQQLQALHISEADLVIRWFNDAENVSQAKPSATDTA